MSQDRQVGDHEEIPEYVTHPGKELQTGGVVPSDAFSELVLAEARLIKVEFSADTMPIYKMGKTRSVSSVHGTTRLHLELEVLEPPDEAYRWFSSIKPQTLRVTLKRVS